MRSVLAFVAILMIVFSVHATIEVHEFESLQQEQQFKELSNTLRCPKCQNNTIGDSNAPLAQDLRQKVYEMTKEGKSKQDIIDYMIARYGNFVTYNPPFTFATAILWLGPLLVVVIGFTLIVVRSRNNKAKPLADADGWSDEKEAKLNALLKDQNTGDKSQ